MFRGYFEKKLGDKAYDCALWAFGEGFEDIEMADLPARWNQRHSEKFILYDYNEYESDIDRIILSWESINDPAT